ncbi:MAG: hypothetical protein V9E83_07405 [Baekduia sp.]
MVEAVEPQVGGACVVGVLEYLDDPVELVDIQVLRGLLSSLDRLPVDPRRFLALQATELLNCCAGERLVERIVDGRTGKAIEVQALSSASALISEPPRVRCGHHPSRFRASAIVYRSTWRT